MNRLHFGCALILCAVLSPLVHAQPIVSGWERFHDEQAVQRHHGGRLLVEELNCVACHGNASLVSKQAPILAEVSGRVTADHMRRFIADPASVKPGTTMPHVFAGVDPNQRQEQVEALVHFLMSLGPGAVEGGYASFGGRSRGEKLFHSVGCVACHGPRSDSAPVAGAKPLGNLPEKYTVTSLAGFLRDPLHVRPSGRMPDLQLSEREALDLASYLLPDVPVQPGILFSYYELSSPERLPNFDQLQPQAVGAAAEFDPSEHGKRGNHFGLRYEGELVIRKEGTYRFHVRSDDGSRLWLDDQLVVDNDGVHGAKQVTGAVALTPGRVTVRIDFFEKDGGEELDVTFDGPGIDKTELAAALLATPPKVPLTKESFSVKSGLAEQGRRLFTQLGCAACHQTEPLIHSSLEAPAWGSLDARKGCLADNPKVGVDYRLSRKQRQAIRDAMKEGAVTLQPEQRVRHTMLQLNCFACHARDGIGGVPQELNAYFTTTQPEMGVEGSIPPHLDGVGAKLTAEWLRNILASGAKDRPYMLTRMPKFGSANAGHLASLVEELDRTEPLEPLVLERPAARRAGHRLVGVRGFSCIKCHTFGRHQATGVQSIDMTIMTKRLREDWFRSYVRNPQVYRRGTRMPSAWPAFGPSLIKDVLDGDTDKQIMAVWTYLRDGMRAKTPAGLASSKMELVPTEEAIIYRNFIQGAGPRAIGVGYPEGMNVAFDAEDLRFALIWQGAFIDASRHWQGRGQGFQPPAGGKVEQLAPQVAVAKLDDARSAWPTTHAPGRNAKFLGYRVTSDQRPTFLYRVDDLLVEDFVTPVETATSTTLSRSITIVGTTSPLTYLRLAVGDIRKEDDTYRVGDALSVVISDEYQPTIRERGGTRELLIPLADSKSERTILVEYAW